MGDLIKDTKELKTRRLVRILRKMYSIILNFLKNSDSNDCMVSDPH